MAAHIHPHELEEDLIHAACEPNPSVLFELLSRHDIHPSFSWTESFEHWYTSPLLSSILARLPQNSSLLLYYNADPDGLTLHALKEYSVRYMRFRAITEDGRAYGTPPLREKLLSISELPQNHQARVKAGVEKTQKTRRPLLRFDYPQNYPKLTTQEIEERYRGRTRFWSEMRFPGEQPIEAWRESQDRPVGLVTPGAMTAVEAAVWTGDKALLDELISRGADISFWQLPVDVERGLPHPLTPSSISVSTPLHAAIQTGNSELVEHLLTQYNLNPNTLPLAAITRAITPLMLTIITNQPKIYSLICASPLIDHNIRTPVYSIHPLHIAIATLSIPLLSHILLNYPPNFVTAAGTTALGHNLLHIATLPLDDSYINVFSPVIYSSVHEVRTLSSTWTSKRLRPTYSRNAIFRPANPQFNEALQFPPAPSRDYFPSQFAVSELLLQSCTPMQAAELVAARDVHGNTPLHYLASHRDPHLRLIQLLREVQGGGEVWLTCKNRLGHTPEEFLEERVKAEGTMSGGIVQRSAFWNDRSGIVCGGKEVD